MTKKKIHKLIFIFSFLTSIICSIIRIQIGVNDGVGFYLFFGIMTFPISITLIYFTPKRNDVGNKIVNYIFSILVIMPILLIQFSIENYFIDEHLAKYGINIKSLIVDYIPNRRTTTYFFNYKINGIEYTKSVNIHTKEYIIGDTIEIFVSEKNPDHYEILNYINRNR